MDMWERTSQTSLSSLAANHWSHLITESLVLAAGKVGQTEDEFLNFLRRVLHLCTVASNTHKDHNCEINQLNNETRAVLTSITASFDVDIQQNNIFSSAKKLQSHLRTFESDEAQEEGNKNEGMSNYVFGINKISQHSNPFGYKTYYMSGLILSSCICICMHETVWRAFSTRLSHLCSTCSSSSQSEVDIISGWITAAPTLEYQDSISSSSAIICPWIPSNNMDTSFIFAKNKV